jgi:glycosyltransferase involved in cell wall biosynthesis
VELGPTSSQMADNKTKKQHMVQRSTEKPRVLMFVPKFPYPIIGGLEKQSLVLSKSLASDQGLEVMVLSEKLYNNQPDVHWVDGIKVQRLRQAKSPLTRALLITFSISYHLWTMRRKYDIIHLHQHSWIGLFVIQIANILRKPILTKLPNVGDAGIPGMRKMSLGKIRLILLLRSSAIVAMSEQSKGELSEARYPLNRILSVPNGIQLSPVAFKCRSRSCDSKTVCRVVFLGRLNRDKGIDVLLHAWSTLQEQIANRAILEIWGAGPEEDSLLKLQEELGIATSTKFEGMVTNVREKLREVDVLVLPSRCEGNSNSILEAMEAGLPIIATDVGGTRMQVGAQGRRLLVPYGDIGQLAAKLAELVQHPELRREYGRAMRQRVEQYFDISKISAMYKQAYIELMNESQPNMAVHGQLPDE